MREISIILKNNNLITSSEFKALERYSSCGRLWTVVHKPSNLFPHKVTSWGLEYIFDPEAYTIFCLISNNILANWETEYTRNLNPYEEFYLKDSIFIRLYDKS